MACNQYFGLQTSTNRIRWKVAAALFTAGVAFLIAYSVVRVKMHALLEECMTSRDIIEKYGKAADHRGDLAWLEQVVAECNTDYPELVGVESMAVALQIVWLILWVAASIPIYMMCCCTRPPVAVGVTPPTAMACGHTFDSLLDTK